MAKIIARSFLGETVDFEMIKLKQELSAAPKVGEPAFTLSAEDETDPTILFQRSDLAANRNIGRLRRSRRPEAVEAQEPNETNLLQEDDTNE